MPWGKMQRKAGLGQRLLLAFLVIAGLPAITGVFGWLELRDVSRSQSQVITETIPAIAQVRGFAEETSRIVSVAPELAAVSDEASRSERAAFLLEQVNALAGRLERAQQSGVSAPADLGTSLADMRAAIIRLDRMVRERITARVAQARLLDQGLRATTEVLDISDTLVANAEMAISAVVSNLYELSDNTSDQEPRFDTLDRLIEVDLFQLGQMHQLRAHAAEIGLLLNRIASANSHTELLELRRDLIRRVDIVSRRIGSVRDPVRAKRAQDLLQSILPERANSARTADLFAVTTRIIDLGAQITQSQRAVRLVTNRLESQAAVMADEIQARAVRSGEAGMATILHTQLLYAWGPIAALLLSLGVLWFYVRGSITRRLDALSAAILRLANGALDANAPAEGRDEIAEMGRAVEVFRQQALSNSALEAERRQNLEELAQHRNELQRLVDEQTEQLRGEVAAHAQARALAETADRAKSEFLAMMSHEIKTPMNGVLGMLRALSHDQMPPRQQEFLRAALGSGEGLMSILNDILEYSRGDSTQPMAQTLVFSPETLVRDTVLLMQPSAHEKGLTLVLDLPCGPTEQPLPAALRGDMGKLRQILFNLLSNALKFTEMGKVTVRVTATSAPQDPHQGLIFSIHDTGRGIAPEALDRIFEVFEQEDRLTARQYGGTGLGLAVCRRFAALMGAELTVASTPGVGSEFILRANFDWADQTALQLQNKTSPKLDPLCVLVVEDHPVNQMVILTFLETMGHRAVLASSGEAALIRLGEQRFDLVLMDVNLPGISGIETTRRLRARADTAQAFLPVIGVSAHLHPDEATAARNAGMTSFFAKPLTPERLATAMLQAIAPDGSTITENLPYSTRMGVPQIGLLADTLADLGPDRTLSLAQLFSDRLASEIMALQTAIDRRDSRHVSRLSHQLRGAAGNFDLPDMIAHLARLERAAQADDAAAQARALKDLHPMVAAVLERLQGEIAQIKDQLSASQAAQ